jgi:DNA polymerase iota
MNSVAYKRNEISPKSNEKFMALIMQLFRKMVDVSKPFHLTLLGLAFTKFRECKSGKSSIASFLTNDTISVQSVLSLKSVPETEKMEYSCMNSTPCMERSDSDCELEHESKRARTGLLIQRSKKQFSSEDDTMPVKQMSEGPAGNSADCALCMVSGSESPNEQTLDTHKIPVGRSNSSVVTENISFESQTNSSSSSAVCDMINIDEFQSPHNVDADVFHALPHELKKELIEAWRMDTSVSSASQSTQGTLHSKPKQKSILQYFLPNN